MQNIVTLGRRLIPIEQIALVEAFNPAANSQFKTGKAFKARVVLINRDCHASTCIRTLQARQALRHAPHVARSGRQRTEQAVTHEAGDGRRRRVAR